MIDLTQQLDISFRLLAGAVLGAAVGAEREIHGHSAGMRTHLLVAVGAAMFTVLGIFAFGATDGPGGADPSRIAAQIVSGIGFLGAGAILKDGLSIRGLTTAASLWAVAAVGMSVGAGQYLIALVGTVIILVSLWPLNLIADRLHSPGTTLVHLRVHLERLDSLGAVWRALTASRLEIAGIQSQRLGKGRYEAHLDVRFRTRADLLSGLQAIGSLPGVEVTTTEALE
jgi:putative Mg2+ transporter-C (MgtC) family protein